MSLVDKILTSAEKIQVTEITKKISSIDNEIDALKEELHNYILAKYKNYTYYTDRTESLATQLDILVTDIKQTTTVIETEIEDHLSSSSNEIYNLQCQLKKSFEVAYVLDTLAKITLSFGRLTKSADNLLVNRSKTLAEISTSLSNLIKNGYTDEEIDVLRTIEVELSVQREDLLYKLVNEWNEKVKWCIKHDEDGICQQTQLTISNDKDRLKDILLCMYHVDHINICLKRFSELLLNNVFLPVINNTAELDVKNQINNTVLQITKVSDDFNKPTVIFSILKQVIQLLCDTIITFPSESTSDLTECCIDDKMSLKDLQLIDLISGFCRDDMSKQLIEGPLSNALPVNHSELLSFSNITSEIIEFNSFLGSVGFVQKDDEILQKFINNVEILSVNKECQSLIEKARALMKSVLHESVLSIEDNLQHVLDNIAIPTQDSGDSSEVQNTFSFPECHISICVRDLVKLAYDMLLEATKQTSSSSACKLFYCVKNMFELFCTVVPTYHKQSLSTLPQITALHYNNCMFIVHHLKTLGFIFSPKMLPPLNNPETCMFVDILHKISQLGKTSFANQLDNQKTQLITIIQSATDGKGFVDASEEANCVRQDRALKQCLYQLNHLQRILQPILPSNVYNKSIGTLVNTVMKEMMDNILMLEDISTDDANALYHILTQLKTACVSLFQSETHPISTAVCESLLQKKAKNTIMLAELALVLNGNLLDIDERWAAGKGPLASALDPKQVKQLIRALFQNTDRRASVLSKIH